VRLQSKGKNKETVDMESDLHFHKYLKTLGPIKPDDEDFLLVKNDPESQAAIQREGPDQLRIYVLT